jgi:DNA excision repair protein ERCC-4
MLGDWREDMIRVIVDERERSQVPARLRELGLTLDFRLLEEGDYVMAGYAIERKTVRDFLSSLYSGRLFDQAYRLGQAYRFPLMIVEGDYHSILNEMRNPRVFWGALATLSFGYGLRVFFTWNAKQTADLIDILARHLPELRSRPPAVVRKPRSNRMREWQAAFIQGLPGVGSRLAEQLLKRFGTPRRVLSATEAELSLRGGLGRTKAAKIKFLLDTDYNALDESKQLRLSEARP